MSEEKAARIAQAKTGQALATGKAPKHENAYLNGRAKAEQYLNCRMEQLGMNCSQMFTGEDDRVENEIKGWKHAGRDLAKWRQDQADAQKEYVVHRLNADGRPSGMHDAQTRFGSEKEALDKIAYWRSINPGKKLRYSLNGKEV